MARPLQGSNRLSPLSSTPPLPSWVRTPVSLREIPCQPMARLVPRSPPSRLRFSMARRRDTQRHCAFPRLRLRCRCLLSGHWPAASLPRACHSPATLADHALGQKSRVPIPSSLFLVAMEEQPPLVPVKPPSLLVVFTTLIDQSYLTSIRRRQPRR